MGRPIHGSITKQTTPMYDTIRARFESIAPDLTGLNAERYQRNISSGIQEFMEAVMFEHYLTHQRLLPFPAAAALLPDGVLLTHTDYLLGIFDMTGELMRFCITYMATNGKQPGGGAGKGGASALADMRALRAGLEGIRPAGIKEFYKKLQVTQQSVQKVEGSVYSMVVRGEERPKGWRPDAVPEGRGGWEEGESD
jgi:predicted translin family RNA/ssDNA-binding protein